MASKSSSLARGFFVTDVDVVFLTPLDSVDLTLDFLDLEASGASSESDSGFVRLRDLDLDIDLDFERGMSSSESSESCLTGFFFLCTTGDPDFLTELETFAFDLAARGTSSSSESDASFLTLGFFGDFDFSLFNRCPNGVSSSSELEGGVFRFALPYKVSYRSNISHKHLIHS